MAKFKCEVKFDRFRVNSAGARQLMNSPAMQADLLSRATSIKARADGMGSGVYAADVQAGRNRAHAMVKTTDALSMASNAKHNTLLKALS